MPLQITASQALVIELGMHVTTTPAFAEELEASLQQAQSTAEAQLDPDLYAALDWPVTFPAYYQFLLDFAQWVPDQSDNPGWQIPGTDHYQEVYDRLCHFYYLIDQSVDGAPPAQNDPWFCDWLVRYADAWGSFLNTPGSFTEADLQSYIQFSPQYRVEDSLVDGKPNAPSGWNTFNQFFARELNPGLRPITQPMNNALVTSPADCTYHQSYPIDDNSNVQAPDGQVLLKGTHAIGSIPELLDGSPYADAFAGGVFAHYFLAPYSYHRFHTPAAGKIVECRPVQGLTYLAVNITDSQFDAPDDADDGYEFKQARGILIVDTTGSEYGDVGLVGVVPVGMCQVSSVHMTATLNSELLKGDEFGYFLFGGSDIILLFQKGVVQSLNESTDYRHYGQESAECTSPS